MKAKKHIPKKLPKLPRFKNEDEEREFWATHSLTDYLHIFKPVKLDLSHLKPSTSPVTVRLPQGLLEDLRRLANRRDVPYQSLLKIYLAERVELEMRRQSYK